LSKSAKAQSKIILDLELTKLNQLRQSRIAIWVKSYVLRKAQYLSGLRQLLPVERYQKRRLEYPQRRIEQHHSIK